MLRASHLCCACDNDLSRHSKARIGNKGFVCFLKPLLTNALNEVLEGKPCNDEAALVISDSFTDRQHSVTDSRTRPEGIFSSDINNRDLLDQIN